MKEFIDRYWDIIVVMSFIVICVLCYDPNAPIDLWDRR